MRTKPDRGLQKIDTGGRGRTKKLTSASVSLLLPPKNGPALANSGSISLATALAMSPRSASLSASVLAAVSAFICKAWTLENHVSTKKAMRARASGPSGSVEAGTSPWL